VTLLVELSEGVTESQPDTRIDPENDVSGVVEGKAAEPLPVDEM
jgi:hypothetical protein